MKARTLVWLVALAIACKSNDETPARQAAPGVATLRDLSTSRDAFRSEQSAHKHEALFLTLLSPT